MPAATGGQYLPQTSGHTGWQGYRRFQTAGSRARVPGRYTSLVECRSSYWSLPPLLSSHCSHHYLCNTPLSMINWTLQMICNCLNNISYNACIYKCCEKRWLLIWELTINFPGKLVWIDMTTVTNKFLFRFSVPGPCLVPGVRCVPPLAARHQWMLCGV